MKHHKYSPSKLAQAKACPGAIRMQTGIPEVTSEDAEFGTQIHNAIATGEGVDKLSVEQLLLYETCISELSYLPLAWKHEVEFCLLDEDLSELTSGTIDCLAEHKDGFIIAYDWKLGRNKVKAPQENLQCWAYAGALMQTYNRPVEFHIFQPTIRSHEKYVFKPEELFAIQKEIRGIIARCNAEELVLNAGIEQCRYCRAKELCPAYREFSMASENTAELIKVEHSHELSNENLVKFYLQWREYDSRYKLLKKVADNVEHQITTRLLKNDCDGLISHFSLKPKTGARDVTQPNELFSELSSTLDVNQFLKCVKVKLGELETIYTNTKKEKFGQKKTDAKKELNEIVNKYSERKSDGYTLVFNAEKESNKIEGETNA
jgi:hypothetical protein